VTGSVCVPVDQRGIAEDERSGFRKDDRAAERYLRRQDATIHIGHSAITEILDVYNGILLRGYFRHCNVVVIFAVVVVETYVHLAGFIRRIFDYQKRLIVIREIERNG